MDNIPSEKLNNPPVPTRKAFPSAFSLILIILSAALIIASLNGSRTVSLFSDLERSIGNFFSAGNLDFELDAGPWELEDLSLNMSPGDTVTRDVELINTGSSEFSYTVNIENITGDLSLCNALVLSANLGATSTYQGPLLGYSSGPHEFSDPENFFYSASLPTSTPLAPGLICNFDFVYRAFLFDSASSSSGFSHSRTLTNTLGSFVSSTEKEVRIAPIADSYVSESNKNKNYGDEDELYVKTKKSENRRAFLRFAFSLPPATKILFSELKLFMDKKPDHSRNLNINTVLDTWEEHKITWNNQPYSSPSSTDTITVPKKDDIWISFDVTKDVEVFTLGTLPNNGWRISDSVEDNKSTVSEVFVSREEDLDEADKHKKKDYNRRPVLEIAFMPPLVYTDHVVINEVYSRVDRENRGDDSENEWVELYNPTDLAVDLTGFKICDSSSCDTLPASTTLPAKGFALISREAKTWGYWPEIPTGTLKIVLNSSIGNGLSNSSDAVLLRNASGTIIDALNYGSYMSYHPVIQNVMTGNSLARIIKGYDTNSTSDWIENASPNPGTNPSNGGMEIMRFTENGVEVAALKDGLKDLYNPLRDGPLFTEEDTSTDETNEVANNPLMSIESSPKEAVAPPVLLDAPTSTSTSTTDIVKESEESEEESTATSTATSTEALENESSKDAPSKSEEEPEETNQTESTADEPKEELVEEADNEPEAAETPEPSQEEEVSESDASSDVTPEDAGNEESVTEETEQGQPQ